MAVLAVAGIGAVAAAGIGWGAGLTGAALLTAASIGFSVGNIAGNLMFPSINQSTSEGARLSDLSVMSSAYGAAIPIVMGAVRIGGNVIWAQPIREQRNSSTATAGGKGGARQRQTTITYTYFGTFALAVCEGPVDRILRMWADGKIIYDATSGTDTVRATGLKFRFYDGSETQLPDSIIEADKGTGNVSAHRGLCYLVFDDIPLADYGNRIPNLNVEVATSTTAAYNTDTLTQIGGSIFPTPVYDGAFAVDFSRDTFWINVRTGSTYGMQRCRISTMTVDKEIFATDALSAATDFDGLVGGTDGNLYCCPEDILKVDSNTMLELGSFPKTNSSPNTTTHFYVPGFLGTATALLPTGSGRRDFVICSGVFGSIGVLKASDMSYVWGAGEFLTNSGASNGRGGFVIQGRSTYNVCQVFCLSYALTGAISIDRLTITVNQTADLLGELVEEIDVVQDSIKTWDASDFDPAASRLHHAGAFVSYQESDDSLIFQVATYNPGGGASVNSYLVKLSVDGDVVWTTQLPYYPLANAFNVYGRNVDVIGMMLQDYTAIKVDPATGSITHEDTWPSGNMAYAQFYLPSNDTVVGWNGTVWKKLYLDRHAIARPSLADFIADICDRCQLEIADYDVSDITDTFVGVVADSPVEAADILRPLLAAFQIDVVERDYAIVFQPRGTSPVAAITENDLIRLESKGTDHYEEKFTHELDLPAHVSLSFLDHDRDHMRNTVSAKRMQGPVATMYSSNSVSLAISVVSDAATMRQLAERLMYEAWTSRHTFDIRLPPSFLRLDAADVVTITLNNGYQMRGRLSRADIGADYSIETTLVAENAGQYISVAGATTGVAWTQTISNPTVSKLILLDVPLLRDTDDMAGTAHRFYWAGGDYSDEAWPGGVLQTSPDLSYWADGLGSGDEMAWGYTETALVDGEVYHTQRDASFIVTMYSGGDSLVSITDLQLANGFNAMAVIKVNGEAEIIQFRDVVALGSSRYQLSVLNRGRRGTDTMASDHASGEIVVMLTSSTVLEWSGTLAQRNVTSFYRLVTSGMLPDTAAAQGFAFSGRDLMPYAPVSVAGELAGSDIEITWLRRTRMNGDLAPGTGDVPLNEYEEAYEVDILDVPGGTVLRTLTGMTSETATYAAASITADFGSTPSELSVIVYQISSIVGRGFGREYLLEIA